LKEFLKHLKEATLLYYRRRGNSLAAAATFFIILSSVPFLLLTVRLVGFFVGGGAVVEEIIGGLGPQLFPDLSQDFLLNIKVLLSGPLFASSSMNFFNGVILLFTSVSFLNTIWNGLFLISGDPKLLNWKNTLKGMGIMGITLLLILASFLVQPFILLIFNILQNNLVIDYFRSDFPALKSVLDYFLGLRLESNFLFHSNVFFFVFFVVYFAFLYRSFFRWKISMKESLVSSAVFVFLFLLGKNLFWVYFLYIRSSLMRNYGDYYTFILVLIWAYLVMCFFFYGACLCVSFIRRPLELSNKKARGEMPKEVLREVYEREKGEES
jgi:membrane protein